MNDFLKNKKADIPVAILVIGVIAVCSFAIFSFISSSFSLSQSIVGISLIEELNVKIDSYHFYLEKGMDKAEVEEIVGVSGGWIYLEENKSKFLGKPEFLFSIKYRVP